MVAPICFMIMPYGRKPTQAEARHGVPEIDFNALWDKAFAPTIRTLGYRRRAPIRILVRSSSLSILPSLSSPIRRFQTAMSITRSASGMRRRRRDASCSRPIDRNNSSTSRRCGPFDIRLPTGTSAHSLLHCHAAGLNDLHFGVRYWMAWQLRLWLRRNIERAAFTRSGMWLRGGGLRLRCCCSCVSMAVAEVRNERSGCAAWT